MLKTIQINKNIKSTRERNTCGPFYKMPLWIYIALRYIVLVIQCPIKQILFFFHQLLCLLGSGEFVSYAINAQWNKTLSLLLRMFLLNHGMDYSLSQFISRSCQSEFQSQLFLCHQMCCCDKSHDRTVVESVQRITDCGIMSSELSLASLVQDRAAHSSKRWIHKWCLGAK